MELEGTVAGDSMAGEVRAGGTYASWTAHRRPPARALNRQGLGTEGF